MNRGFLFHPSAQSPDPTIRLDLVATLSSRLGDRLMYTLTVAERQCGTLTCRSSGLRETWTMTLDGTPGIVQAFMTLTDALRDVIQRHNVGGL